MAQQLDDTGDPYNPWIPDSVTLTELDASEWQKMQRFTPAPDGQEPAPWWQNLVSYGITKAIDNTFPSDPRGIQGNTAPGSFAGQNGRTYNQRGSQAAPPSIAAAINASPTVQRMGGLPVLLGLGALAFAVLRKG